MQNIYGKSINYFLNRICPIIAGCPKGVRTVPDIIRVCVMESAEAIETAAIWVDPQNMLAFPKCSEIYSVGSIDHGNCVSAVNIYAQ